MESSARERQYIVDYVSSQARDETVENLEKVTHERVLGRDIDVWDVHTDLNRWWVITAPTNLYSQEQFPSMDVALSFHIGLTTRVMERNDRTAPGEQAEHFPVAWRKWDQSGEALNKANEAEDFQAVGMRCRESLIAFVHEASSVVKSESDVSLPKASDFNRWAELIGNTVAAGSASERRRSYLKSAAKSTWQLVNWLTHATNATEFDAYFAFQATGHFLSSWSLSLMRFERGDPWRCSKCGSYALENEDRYDDGIGTLRTIICKACSWKDEPVLIQEAPTDSDKAEPEPATGSQDLGSCVFVDVPLRGPAPPKPS